MYEIGLVVQEGEEGEECVPAVLQVNQLVGKQIMLGWLVFDGLSLVYQIVHCTKYLCSMFTVPAI